MRLPQQWRVACRRRLHRVGARPFAACLLLASVLHLMGLWITNRALHPAGREVVFRVQLGAPRLPARDPAPAAPAARDLEPGEMLRQLGHSGGMPRPWRAGGGLGAAGRPTTEGSVGVGGAPLSLGGPATTPGAMGVDHAVPQASTAAEPADLARVRREAAAREGWARLPLADADTTDEDSRRRRRAEEIVDRAIAAMGGLERLAAVQDMTITPEVRDPRTEEWVPGTKRAWRLGHAYREDLGRGMRQGFDGRVSYYWRYGLLLLPPDLRQSAERWDFLSRYRGQGVAVE